ncbi:MAG: hypothetical protein EA400_14945 [Chromatiaceae bacterium]|nr:MAG: hypothetical protein EA400_14945 [Chromatiaceae bacterium]
MARHFPVAPQEVVAPPLVRYTLDGDAAVEARIERDQWLVAEEVVRVVPPKHFVALVLMGGYGRGEGGHREIDETPAAYNDYDYYVVVRRTMPAARAALAASLDAAAARLRKLVDVEVELRLLRYSQLPGAEFSLLNAEMRWGHQVVVGDPEVLARMPPMPFHRLPPGEFTRLLLNRGTLLLLNQQHLRRGALPANARERFFKHLFKAVLACGDARLAMLGRYHPSYPVKRARLAAIKPHEELPDHWVFLDLYRQAYRQRFHPDYEFFHDADPAQWQARVCCLWLRTLWAFESQRLGHAFERWSDYCRPTWDKGQGGSALSNLAATLGEFGLLDLLHWPASAVRYPRERLIAALPLLLNESGAIPNPCVPDLLALSPWVNWEQAAAAYLARWQRYI